MSAIPTKHIDGDVDVGRNVSMGGDATIRGNATIDHDLKVNGWLDAKNIKGILRGLFESESILNETYPNPEEGWCALVGDSLPADVYVVRQSVWVPTGKKGGTPTMTGNPISDDIEKRLKALEDSRAKAYGLATLNGYGELPEAMAPHSCKVNIESLHKVEQAFLKFKEDVAIFHLLVDEINITALTLQTKAMTLTEAISYITPKETGYGKWPSPGSSIVFISEGELGITDCRWSKYVFIHESSVYEDAEILNENNWLYMPYGYNGSEGDGSCNCGPACEAAMRSIAQLTQKVSTIENAISNSAIQYKTMDEYLALGDNRPKGLYVITDSE